LSAANISLNPAISRELQRRLICFLSPDFWSHKMDQITLKPHSAQRRRQARLAKGYSYEDLAIATGLTVAEIAATEEADEAAPVKYLERIEHALF